MKVLQNIFRTEARRIWQDTAKAISFGLSQNEETITETMLLNLAKQCEGTGLCAIPYSKATEKVNGADWEWWFTSNGEGVAFRVQAKRLFESGRYESLKPKGSQIKNLISQASDKVPMLAFYNFQAGIAKSMPFGSIPKGCDCSAYRRPSYWGCSLEPARIVETQGKTKFRDMHPNMIPMHCLFCQKISWSRGGKPPPLADLVERSLKDYLQTIDAGAEIETVRKIDIPEEIQRLLEGSKSKDGRDFSSIERDEKLDKYLDKRELSGVLVVSSKIRGE
jgi:hypothetical protein